MLILCLALAAGWTVSIATLTSLIARQQREHHRRQNLLIDQLLHAAGRTWTPPPADTGPPLEPTKPRRVYVSPDQEPIDTE